MGLERFIDCLPDVNHWRLGCTQPRCGSGGKLEISDDNLVLRLEVECRGKQVVSLGRT